MKLFNHKNTVNREEEQLTELRQRREACAARIREIKGDMSALVGKAAEGDELEQQILSLDYTMNKNLLSAEMERFRDLSDLILRLMQAQQMRDKGERVRYVERVGSRIDTGALLREQDEIAARRALLEEDAEDMAFAATEASRPAFAMDEDFSRLVSQAKREKAAAPAREARVPAAEVMA